MKRSIHYICHSLMNIFAQETLAVSYFRNVLTAFQKATKDQQFFTLCRAAETEFRLKNYEVALEFHLQAQNFFKQGSARNQMNIYIVLDYLALGKKQKVLQLFHKLTSKRLYILTLQVFINLRMPQRALQAYNLMKEDPQFLTSFGRVIHSNILLILIYKQTNQKQLQNQAFQQAYKKVLTVQRSQLVYEVFQWNYFLLKYCYQTNRLQQGKTLALYARLLIQDIADDYPEAAKFMDNQLQKGEDYDITLLYFRGN